MKVELGMSKQSIKEFSNSLMITQAAVVQVGVDVIDEIAYQIYTDSVKITPFDTYSLRRSAYVTASQFEEGTISSVIGYASPDTDVLNLDSGKWTSEYAEEVHDEAQYLHAPGTDIKFLQQTVAAYSDKYIKLLEERFTHLFS